MSDVALDYMHWLTTMLARDLFPNLRRFKLQLHESDTDIGGTCSFDGKVITLRRNLDCLPRSWVCQVITHELCHAATTHEHHIDHGPAWCRAMRKRGIEPLAYGAISGALITGGPLHLWLQQREWAA